jgi:hypothetical protein
MFKNIDLNKQLPLQVNKQLFSLLQQYIIVGGMPAAVDLCCNTNDMTRVYEKQISIINSIRDDIKKYAPHNLINKIVDCFDSVPNQLAREYKKFKFNSVATNVRIERYIDAIK